MAIIGYLKKKYIEEKMVITCWRISLVIQICYNAMHKIQIIFNFKFSSKRRAISWWAGDDANDISYLILISSFYKRL